MGYLLAHKKNSWKEFFYFYEKATTFLWKTHDDDWIFSLFQIDKKILLEYISGKMLMTYIFSQVSGPPLRMSISKQISLTYFLKMQNFSHFWLQG